MREARGLAKAQNLQDVFGVFSIEDVSNAIIDAIEAAPLVSGAVDTLSTGVVAAMCISAVRSAKGWVKFPDYMVTTGNELINRTAMNNCYWGGGKDIIVDQDGMYEVADYISCSILDALDNYMFYTDVDSDLYAKSETPSGEFIPGEDIYVEAVEHAINEAVYAAFSDSVVPYIGEAKNL